MFSVIIIWKTFNRFLLQLDMILGLQNQQGRFSCEVLVNSFQMPLDTQLILVCVVAKFTLPIGR